MKVGDWALTFGGRKHYLFLSVGVLQVIRLEAFQFTLQIDSYFWQVLEGWCGAGHLRTETLSDDNWLI